MVQSWYQREREREREGEQVRFQELSTGGGGPFQTEKSSDNFSLDLNLFYRGVQRFISRKNIDFLRFQCGPTFPGGPTFSR